MKRLVVCSLLFSAFAACWGRQAAKRHSSLKTAADQPIIVRFFYQPALSSRHPALLFRVVGDNDSRLNTMSIAESGYNVFITSGEMMELVQRLSHAALLWQESNNVDTPQPFKGPVLTDGMEIKVFSQKGTEKSLIAVKQICATLEQLDSVFKEHRALWEYQMFRRDDGCSVPGLNQEAYPDHWGQR